MATQWLPGRWGRSKWVTSNPLGCGGSVDAIDVDKLWADEQHAANLIRLHTPKSISTLRSWSNSDYVVKLRVGEYSQCLQKLSVELWREMQVSMFHSPGRSGCLRRGRQSGWKHTACNCFCSCRARCRCPHPCSVCLCPRTSCFGCIYTD